ncbi:BrnA antitoxin family protein [Patescibacteria group bacterium]|nr:BrnA antitoxin family protein [Patescibacteria group bacterium]
MMTHTGKIPTFKTIKEEAKFWDTHDITDYLSEMKSVEVEFVVPREKKKNFLLSEFNLK